MQPVAPPPDPLTPRETIGRFEVLRRLPEGGMGVVYEGWDPELGRRVAIKTLHPAALELLDLRRRFDREAPQTAQIEHPNIVPVYESGVDQQGRPFFVMRLVEGRSLRDVLEALRAGDPEAEERWSLRRLLVAFVQVCQAVAFAHERGVVHRDLKPANIMTGPLGEVVVVDWGLSRQVGELHTPGEWAGSGEQLTQDGAVIGTPGYIAPEQTWGKPVDAKSDVWSLGAILYELLTREPAFTGDSFHSLYYRPATEPPQPPQLRAPDRLIPKEIAEVCMKALALAPEDRFPDAAALAVAVEAFLEGSQRREEAERHLAEGLRLEARWRELQEEHRALAEQAKLLARQVPPWAPLEEKGELLAMQARVRNAGPEIAIAFAQAVAAGERALSRDPEHAPSRAFLATLYWARFEQAEASQDEANRVFFAERVRAYDDGPLTSLLQGDGRLSLRTDPPGALVLCRRVIHEGLVWPLSEPEVLGRTPLVGVKLPMGSYVLTLVKEGYRDTTYPVLITRRRHWDEAPVRLLTEAQIGAGWVYVPTGPAQIGGDRESRAHLLPGEHRIDGFLIARHLVTAGEAIAWINELQRVDPAKALDNVPSHDQGVNAPPGPPYWELGPDGVWRIPPVDRDGDPWSEDLPTFGMNWFAAMEYAAWVGARDGRPTTLPTEHQWEKAARGVDARIYPWGDHFDPTLCRMEQSVQGRHRPSPVGSYPHDRSVYGVMDMAGLLREWCLADSFDGDPERRPLHGGTFLGPERLCRAANRYGYKARSRRVELGIRLARALPDP